MESFCSLKQKEVINIRDGYRFGFIDDVEIDISCGNIIALILPAECGFLNLFPKDSYKIPWNCICKMGEDVILVDVDLDCIRNPEKCRCKC